MNPAILAALIRGAGAVAARQGAKKGATAAAGKINWGAVANGIADALPTVMQGASMLRGLRAGRGEGSQEEGRDDASEADIARKAFQARLDRGESIHADELAKAPESHIPEALRDFAAIVRDARKNGPQPHHPGQGVASPSIPVQQTQATRQRGPDGRFLPVGGMPDPAGAEQRSGPPPIANDDQKSKDRSLKQMLSDLIFSQTEKRRGQPESPPENARGGAGGSSVGGAGGGNGSGAGNPPPGSNQPGGNDDEGKEAAKGFSDRLKDGAAKVGEFAGTIGKAYVAAAGFVKGLELLNRGVLELNRDLAQYNGNLAQVYAQSDVRQMQRDVKRADGMEAPLSGLSEANSELRDTLEPPITAIATVATGILTGVTKVTTLMLKIDPMFNLTTYMLEEMASMMRKILMLGEKKEENNLGPWHNFFADVTDGKHDGLEPKFQGPKSLFTDDERKRIFGK